jgi:ATP-dependent Clp protease ATP-binding subunit ClpX
MTTATRSLAVDLYRQTGHVYGQDEARRALSVLLARQRDVAGGLYPEAVGVLAFGRSGVGKTMLVKAMCDLAGIPFAAVDSTQFTDRGYVGPDLSQMFLPLIRSALPLTDTITANGHDEDDSLFGRPRAQIEAAVQVAQRGVLLLDEFDKWLIRGQDMGGRNVGRELQAELLNMVQGSVVWVTDREDELGVDFDTTRCMIICCGAFTGLHNVVLNRLEHDKEFEDETLWTLVEPKDFMSMGIIPELAGRLATHIAFKPLRVEHLEAILREEGGLMEEYVRRFQQHDCELVVEEAGLRAVAATAMKMETGARGLRHKLEKICQDALFASAELQTQGRRSQAVLTVHAAQAQQLEVRPVD